MEVKDQKFISAISEERKHLEGLLKDRFNFYLVFASLFIFGAFRIRKEDPDLYLLVLSLGTIVSLLLLLAIFRTYKLVQSALEKIKSDKNHPYTWLCAQQRNFAYNANHFLIPIPFLVTAFGFYLIFRTIGGCPW